MENDYIYVAKLGLFSLFYHLTSVCLLLHIHFVCTCEGMNPVKIEASPDDPPPTPAVEVKPEVQDPTDDEEQIAVKGDEDETIMMRQTFLLDPDRTVADVVAEGGISVLDFVRFECGETLEEQVEASTKVAQAGG